MDTAIFGGAAGRPFSSWRTPYREGNSSLGYFADLVVEARHASPTVYLKEIGLNGRNIDPREVLSSLLLLPLRAEDREALDSASAFVTPHGVRLAGQSLRRRQWSIARRRWCPGCLAESPHHRTWWDVLPYETCHLHGCPVEAADPDGLPLEWWWPNVAESPRGHRLARAMPRLAETPSNLSAWIVGRMGFAPALDRPLLDGSSVGDAAEFVRLVGRMMASPQTVSAPPAPATDLTGAALSLCMDGGQPLVDAIRAWLLEHVSKEERRKGLNCFGWAVPHARGLRDGHLKGVLLEAMRDALSSVGYARRRPTHGPPRQPPVRRAGLGLHDLAERLGQHHKGVLNVAERIGTMPDREWYRGRLFFTASDIDAITAAFGRLLTQEEAARILRLRSADFGKVVSAGAVAPLLDASRGGARGRRFLREEVEALRDRIAAGSPVPGLPAERKPSRSPVARLASASGTEGREDCPIGLCRAEIEVELAVSCETVAELERLGHLHRLPDSATKGARSLVGHASVAATADRLASARVYHGVLGATAAQVVARLAEHGVFPVVEPRPGGRVTPMFDRVEVRKALGLDRDPDDSAADRISVLWRDLRKRLLIECPRLKCPSRMPADAFTIHTGNRKVMFGVRADRVASAIAIRVPISRANSTRRWGYFEANRAEVLGVSGLVDWQESLGEVEGTITLRVGADVGEAATALERLTRLLGGTASTALADPA